MRLWPHRARPPADASASLERDERVLSWATTDAGEVIVATQRGLWLPARDGRRRLGWHEIDKAAWADGVLTLTAASVVAGDVLHELPPSQWNLAEPRELPAVVRARVSQSVAFTEHFDLEPSGGVRVVARRISGRDGLAWLVRYDEGTDGGDESVRAQVDRLVARARDGFVVGE